MEWEAETKSKEDSGVRKRWFWGEKVASKTKIPTNIDEETLVELKLSHHLIHCNSTSFHIPLKSSKNHHTPY